MNTKRNITIWRDSKLKTRKQIAEEHNISTSAISQIITKQERIREIKPKMFYNQLSDLTGGFGYTY